MSGIQQQTPAPLAYWLMMTASDLQTRRRTRLEGKSTWLFFSAAAAAYAELWSIANPG